jgi:putative membrane protein
MRWWCSATGQPWTWAWRPYPGVWLFVGLLTVWYLRIHRSEAPSGETRRRGVWYLTGLLCIWLALDWPVGALGAGYLASVHTATYILLSLVAPPCLILGIPDPALRRALERPYLAKALVLGARPWLALTVFNAMLLTTHVPAVVDGAMGSQLGAMLIDLGWLVGGLFLWWPVMGPTPAVVRLSRPLKLGYLFLSTLVPIIPSAFLTFADYPLYATYELAPRVWPILTAQQDQQVAGLLMKIVGDLPIWFGFGVIFFRWAKQDEGRAPPAHPDTLRLS